jgi:lysozyme
VDRDLLRKELIRDEGLRLIAYKDSVGLWTIGVGHLLGEVKRMAIITREEATALLEPDIDSALATAKNLVPSFDGLSDARQRVMVNMAFNLGPNRLFGFKVLLARIAAEDWPGASGAMGNSKWATQVGDRAVRLQEMMVSG